MYAVVSSGGKQYRLSAGDVVEVERIAGDVGDQVVFDHVLLVQDGESHSIGGPTVDSARVVGTILEQGKGDKVIVFKFKKRKMYRRKTGHRQLLTRVRIDEIQPEGTSPKAASKAKSGKVSSSASEKPVASKRSKSEEKAEAAGTSDKAEESQE